MTDPKPIGTDLGAVVTELRLRQPAEPFTPSAGPFEDDEMRRLRMAGKREMTAQRWAAIIPKRFLKAALGDLTSQEATPLRDWACAEASPNLLLLGAVGTGKTHAAVAACRVPHGLGASVAFWPVVELLDALRPNGPAGTWDELVNVDRLIIDDLGTERPTDWTHERFGALINRRWLEERPTVATTNLSLTDLEAAIGARTYSRLAGGALILQLTGEDRRRRNA